ncbi:F0F1 ATP synthase subunit gamma [Streptomonospora halophila]|uniref:ATP synthase gamma chain n=1 Tax=Streptomonospora halophila TaxID=427369 RepID=A0ABP9GY83_9ACTN
MGAQLRVYRRRIRSTKSMAKITRAMELIATTRITRAQRVMQAAQPYAREITRAVSALAQQVKDHPLLMESENPTRAAVLVITSDKGLAGAFTANSIKESERLSALLDSQGKEVLQYVVGRKGIAYHQFRRRAMEQTWEGITERPTYLDAREIADALMDRFTKDSGTEDGVDEIHIVSTEFVSMLTQHAASHRALPLEVEEVEPKVLEAEQGGPMPLYDFEPSAKEALDQLLPQYVANRIYFALLESAASQQASRRNAMKAATDNAEELVQNLTRQANQARQAEITNEISEIVGGADALAGASAGSE